MIPDFSSPFVLLDDCSSTDQKPCSRLYSGFIREISSPNNEGLASAELELKADLERGFYVVLICPYEFGTSLVEIGERKGALKFLVFQHLERQSSREVREWLGSSETDQGGIVDLQPAIDRPTFDRAISTIKDRICRGDTYQVNFTYRLKFNVFGCPLVLYRRLRERQPSSYGAIAFLPGGEWILSFSPELFLRSEEGRLTSAPIKGTGEWKKCLEKQDHPAFELSLDPKSRAENLMIVDLLRNDLGRVAQTGSVTVPALFAPERFGSMLHLVSTIQAQVRHDCSLGNILRALFPCGSITGAPKRKTMEIIQELETDQRGIYTGAIGWIDPPSDRVKKAPLPDFCWSVAIRTLELKAVTGAAERNRRPGVMGVGAGILFDSDPDLEYAECQLKSAFLTGLDPGFELFETIHADGVNGCRHLDLHLQRLQASAGRFAFKWPGDEILRTLEKATSNLPGEPHRVRLSLSGSGQISIKIECLYPLSGKVEVALASEPIHSGDLFLRHKTTVRSTYNRALRLAAESSLFDLLFFNERKELCEGARSNVFIKTADGWLTPPLAAGLLPGIMRSVLLGDSTLRVREQTIYLEDLLAAEEMFICNALRGRLPCSLRSFANTGSTSRPE